MGRRWFSLYPEDYLPDLTPAATNPLGHVRSPVKLHGRSPALCYFDKIISNKPDETAHAIRPGWLFTGDVTIIK
jgi:hypothetical protein